MSSNATPTQGIVFKRGDGGGPETFNIVPEVFDVQGPDGEASEIDVTDFASAAREFLMGLPDEGRLTVQMYRDPTSAEQNGLVTDRRDKVQRNFQFILPDAGNLTLSFAAFVLGFSYGSAPDDAVKVSVTLRITGAVTEA